MAIDNDRSSLSGLTEAEAQEFHGLFIKSFIAFTGDCDHRSLPGVEVAAVDPGPKGYAMLDGVGRAVHGILPFVS